MKKLIIVLLVLTACSAPNFDESEIRKQIMDVTQAYNLAWETLDMESVAQYHSDDFHYYWRGQLSVGTNAEFLEAYPEIMATTKEWKMTVLNPTVQVLGKDAAIVAFSVDTHLIATDGSVFDYGSGALSYVWNRINDEWKLAHIHESAKDKESEN